MDNDIDIRQAALFIREALTLAPVDDHALFMKELATRINEMINQDFQGLLTLLYRLDVDEKKLRKRLEEHRGVDAGTSIAELIVERQLEKIKSRRAFRRDNDIEENEKW